MKANEFVKKFGISYAIEVLAANNKCKFFCKELSSGSIKMTDCYSDTPDIDPSQWVEIKDLKRLVKSHELVEKLGGIDTAEAESGSYYTSESRMIEISQAIADVESCQ